MHKPPKKFFEPLANSAPTQYRSIPIALERMTHFFPPHLEKARAKVPGMVAQVDVLLGNLEGAIPGACDIRAVAQNHHARSHLPHRRDYGKLR